MFLDASLKQAQINVAGATTSCLRTIFYSPKTDHHGMDVYVRILVIASLTYFLTVISLPVGWP